MKLHSVVFSPTGGSAKVVESVVAGIMDVVSCEKVTLDVTSEQILNGELCKDDLVVIATPVYGGKMPLVAKERIKGLCGNGALCILVTVYGNRAFEGALCDMADMARTMGLVTIAAGAFVGEHTYSTAIRPIAVGRPDKADLEEAKIFGRAVGESVVSGCCQEVDVSVLKDEPIPESSLANFRNFVKEYQKQQTETPIQYLPEVDTDLCCRCGKCVEECPTSAIAPDCISVDAGKCIKCCACVKSCPMTARSFYTPFAKVLSENFSFRKQPVWMVGK
ncbi:MAG: 4Fe-4S binding protein [Paramuribaculum sp.]|nr:4Fe-4S binding protein [Paramuribaculum sp.]